ncbi:hypothetical protein FACS1894155_09490 [Bacteroidia bacterium]|nr:hypothetical protein FACS1894155_09490 [Bacteroidia bacterium]
MKMYKIFSILFLVGIFFWSCEDNKEIVPDDSGIFLRLVPLKSTNDAGDPNDNLTEEYAIANLSVFLTDVGSNTVTDKYVHVAFSPVNDGSVLNYQNVQLSGLDPATIENKDVYVIANCTDMTSLNAVQTVDDLKALRTPAVAGNSSLTTTGGLPMFGSLPNAKLSDATANNPVSVTLVRTCAKLRVTLFFTGSGWVGANNSFTIGNAAPYTFYIRNDTYKFDISDLVSYTAIPLIPVSGDPQRFQNVTYLYESLQLPSLHLKTTIGADLKEYDILSNFPLPVRNHLYDIQIQILPPLSSSAPSINQKTGILNYQVVVRTYDLSTSEVF